MCLAARNAAPLRWVQNTVAPVDVDNHVYEGALELNVPLLKEVKGFQDLSANLAYRYTKYSSFDAVDSWKIGLNWQIVDSFRIRSTYSSDIRAPNLNDLYQPAGVTSSSYNDRLTGGSAQGMRLASRGNPLLTPEERSAGAQNDRVDLQNHLVDLVQQRCGEPPAAAQPNAQAVLLLQCAHRVDWIRRDERDRTVWARRHRGGHEVLLEVRVGAGNPHGQAHGIRVPPHHDRIKVPVRAAHTHDLTQVRGDGLGILLHYVGQMLSGHGEEVQGAVLSRDEAVDGARDVVDEFSHSMSLTGSSVYDLR
jgi:hypothetical protein